MAKKTVYICGSLRADRYEIQTALLKEIEKLYYEKVIYLRPKAIHDMSRASELVSTDIAMLRHCDEVWVVGYYGADASWEIGYAAAMGIPVKIFASDCNVDRVREDWMLYSHVKSIYRLHWVPPISMLGVEGWAPSLRDITEELKTLRGWV